MKFEKVSFKEFKSHANSNMKCNADEYDNIVMPKRSTAGSAGYDIASPVNITVPAGCKRVIPTGLKVEIDPGYTMLMFVRSSLALHHEIELQTSVSVIDSDYYGNEKNEGHIMIPVKNESARPVYIAAGERIAQGVFVPYGKTADDTATEKRVGGIGSTGEK